MKRYGRQAAVRRRGTIIILVVAVLALLAVIGTVYIISARAERSASASAATNVNLRWAQNGFMNMLVQVMGDSMIDANGQVGGYATAGNPTSYGSLGARNFDYPEIGAAVGQSSYYGTTGLATVPVMRDEAWLAAGLHVSQDAIANPAYFAAGTGDLCRLTQNFFDPATGQYDISFATLSTVYPVTPNTSLPYLCDVVYDQTVTDTSSDDPVNQGGWALAQIPSRHPDSYFNLLPFNDGSGIRYRVGFRIIDTCRMANLNIGCVDDATAKGDTTGNYITSYDLAPAAGVISDGMFFNQNDNLGGANVALNLHNSAAGRAGSSGIAYNNLSGWQHQFAMQMEKLTSPGSGANPFDLSDELELRSYGEFGTAYHARPGLGASSTYICWPRTLCAEGNGVGYPNTPGAGVLGNASRRNYTGYSWVRDIRPIADPSATYLYPPGTGVNNTPGDHAWTLTPSGGVSVPAAYPGFTPVGTNVAGTMNVWPPSPARVNPNPDVSSMSDNDAIFTIAAAATNIATAMTGAGYDSGTATYFAANYLAQRCNCYAQDNTVSDGTVAYYLPHGPSYVDGQGICVRTRKSGSAAIETGATIMDANFSGAHDLITPKAQKGTSLTQVFLGWAAQPFISEVAVEAYTWDNNAGVVGKPPDWKTDGVAWAVVLYNPYNQAISLQGFKLRYQGGRTDLGTTAGGKNYVPAGGYAILYSALNTNTTAANPKPIPTPPTMLIQQQFTSGANINMIQCLPTYNPGNTASVVLERTYYDRTGAAQIYPIELYDFGFASAANVVANPPPAIASSAGTVFCTWEKNWQPAVNPWAVTIGVPAVTASAGVPCNYGGVNPVTPTLGPPNGHVAGSALGVHLLDRNLEGAVTEGGAARKAFASITAFNHIMQTGNSNDDSSTANQNHYSITYQLLNNTTTTPAKFGGLAANDAFAAQLYLYFAVDPKIYSTLPPADAATAYGDVDVSAVKLLDCLAFVDRVSDTTINIGGGNLDINKNRLPGKININTASGDVLRALPGIQLIAGGNPNQVVANILSYRCRWGANNPNPYQKTPPSYNGATGKDYSLQASYPGVGFRSVAEVMIPINDATGGRAAVDTNNIFDKADAGWASIFNLCTVRSDTFVVYGYLEAVKENPPIAGTFTNSTEWYGAASDVSAAGVGGLVRLARLRWVAIVDRSFCNYAFLIPAGQPNAGQANPSFQAPRIVAIKDLPR